MQQMGKILLIVGLGISAVGLVLWFAAEKFQWFGRLPGDIRIEKPSYNLYVPWVSMLLISMVFSIISWIFGKLFK
jgi:hypothetical protein